MKNIVNISELKEGKTIQGFFLCVEKNLRHSKNGDPYLDLVLRDKTGKISAKIWNKINEFELKFNSGDAVAIKGKMEIYQNKKYLIIDRINKATVQGYARFGFDPSLIIPSAKVDPKAMWKELSKYFKQIKNLKLRKMTVLAYNFYKKRVLYFPNTVNKNHNYMSGYLEHVLSLVKIADFLSAYYKLDKDLMLLGAFFTDIGKLQTLKGGYQPIKKKEGLAVDYRYYSRDIMKKFSRKVSGIDKNILLELEHIIISSYVPFERQNSSLPSSKEALALNSIKKLDANINVFENIISLEADEDGVTSKHNLFGRQIFKFLNVD